MLVMIGIDLVVCGRGVDHSNAVKALPISVEPL